MQRPMDRHKVISFNHSLIWHSNDVFLSFLQIDTRAIFWTYFPVPAHTFQCGILKVPKKCRMCNQNSQSLRNNKLWKLHTKCYSTLLHFSLAWPVLTNELSVPRKITSQQVNEFIHKHFGRVTIFYLYWTHAERICLSRCVKCVKQQPWKDDQTIVHCEPNEAFPRKP